MELYSIQQDAGVSEMPNYDTPLCKQHFKELAGLADQIEFNLKLFTVLGFALGFVVCKIMSLLGVI